VKWRVAWVSTWLFAANASGASAESSGWIGRVAIVAGFMGLEGYTTHGTVGTGEPIPDGPLAGAPDGLLQRTRGDDVTASVELGLGRNIGVWLVSLGYQYRYRTDLDVLAYTEGLGRPSQFHNDIETQVLDVNLVRRFRYFGTWGLRPYVGVGVGVVSNRSDSEFVVRELGVSIPEFRTAHVRTTRSVNWNAHVGVTKSFGKRWDVELRYRYAVLGTVENGPYPGAHAYIETEDGMHSHDVLLGTIYRF